MLEERLSLSLIWTGENTENFGFNTCMHSLKNASWSLNIHIVAVKQSDSETLTAFSPYRTMYLLGYIPKDDRLYLGDKELNIVSYSLLVSVLEYQTAVMRRDFGMADKVLPTIPKEQRTRVAHFLEKQVRKYSSISLSFIFNCTLSG